MQRPGILEPECDQIDVGLRSRDSALRFLMETVKNVDYVVHLHCVHGPISLSVVILRKLHCPAGLAFQSRRAFWSATVLHGVKSASEFLLHRNGHSGQVLTAAAHPRDRLPSGHGALYQIWSKSRDRRGLGLFWIE